MFQYIIKRLLLFIPTLFLVSWFTFALSKQVPVDQVAILLNIQGIDDSNELWNTQYDQLYKKMNLNLPEFYFSVKPSYLVEIQNENSDFFEKKFILDISKQKYNKPFIEKLSRLIKQTPVPTSRKLFSSVGLDQLAEKTAALDEKIPIDLQQEILNHLDNKALNKIKWHYPVISFNGFQNQYHRWVIDILNGNFGISLIDTRPVTDKLWEAMKWSILLLVLNLILALLFSFPLGVYNGMNPNSWFDKISNNILFAFFAIPKFWLATLCIIFFTTIEYGTWTNIFPSVGIWYQSSGQGFFSMLANSWEKLILPITILVIPDVAYLARLIRSSVQEESNKEYIKTALSKGMSFKHITTKHVLPNSLIPTISLLVGTLPGAIASTLVIEVIFNIPGIGRLMYDSINHADWPMVYPIVLITSVFAIVLFLLGDVLMAYLNPKIKMG